MNKYDVIRVWGLTYDPKAVEIEVRDGKHFRYQRSLMDSEFKWQPVTNDILTTMVKGDPSSTKFKKMITSFCRWYNKTQVKAPEVQLKVWGFRGFDRILEVEGADGRHWRYGCNEADEVYRWHETATNITSPMIPLDPATAKYKKAIAMFEKIDFSTVQQLPYKTVTTPKPIKLPVKKTPKDVYWIVNDDMTCSRLI